MKQKKVTAKVINLFHNGYSRSGLPFYTVDLQDESGDIWYGCRTKRDSWLNWEIRDYRNNPGTFLYHKTARGTIILDSVERNF